MPGQSMDRAARLLAAIKRHLRKRDLPSGRRVGIATSNVKLGLAAGGIPFVSSIGFLLAVCLRFNLNAGILLLMMLALLLIVAAAWAVRLMSGLTLEVVSLPFMADNTQGRLQLQLHSRRPLDLVQITWESAGTLCHGATFGIAAGQQLQIDIPLTCERRGRHALPRLTVQTTQPLGLWRVHVGWTPAGYSTVYPAPETAAPKAPAERDDSTTGHADHRPGDELQGLRPYIDGDSPRAIAWRLMARTDGQVLASKHMAAAHARRTRNFTLAQATEAGDVEQALRRLSAWIQRAHDRSEPFSLDLGPEFHSGHGHGLAHMHRCLEALARHGLPDPTRATP